MQSSNDVSRLMMYFLRGFVISGHDGFRHLLQCCIPEEACGALASGAVTDRAGYVEDSVMNPSETYPISPDMDGYFLDVTTRRLVYGRKEVVLVSWNVLHVLLKWTWEIYRNEEYWESILYENYLFNMLLHWAISMVSCFQANGMHFHVDGNANDRGC